MARPSPQPSPQRSQYFLRNRLGSSKLTPKGCDCGGRHEGTGGLLSCEEWAVWSRGKQVSFPALPFSDSLYHRGAGESTPLVPRLSSGP